ncbi:MAG: hypothetical protein DMG05_02160 [Acidobacteria bacterium]|nr:MAG: hypothetical protein DMG05_02160 [Acidobacteriota bacterium]
MLQDDQIETWLDPALSEVDRLSELLKAPLADFLDCYPVDKLLLNSGGIDTSECVTNTGAEYVPPLRNGL